MMEWGVNGEVKLDTYLQTWLGIVGVCVGLHLPAEAFESQ